MASDRDYASHSNINRNKNQPYQTRGAQIMKVAEEIRPLLVKWLVGCKNNEGMPVHPSQIRALSLTIAQDIIKQAA